ncbi:MAG: TolC family protein, partial [bacterium]
MKISHKLLLVVCLLPLSVASSFAQDNELSLSEAIQLGLNNNFDIQIEELNVEIAGNNNNWAAAGRWPTISFSLSQSNNFRDVDNPASFLQGLTISNDIGPAVVLNWVLFDGFRVQINRERLQKLQDLSMGNAQLIVENAVQAIINQYYLTQLEKERLDVLEDVFQLSKDRYEYIRLKSELGSAVTFDVLQEQTAFLTDSSNLVTQQVNYRNARRTLNLLIAQEIELEYELVDELEINLNTYELEDLYD